MAAQTSRRRRTRVEPFGTHGWDPALPSMHAVFAVAGPGVRAGVTVGPVENLDVYPFLAELLGLEPAKGIDGRPGVIFSLVMDGAALRSRPPQIKAASSRSSRAARVDRCRSRSSVRSGSRAPTRVRP